MRLDGKAYLRYDGPIALVQTPTKWTTGKLEGAYPLGVGSEGNSAVTFHGLKLVRGSPSGDR